MKLPLMSFQQLLVGRCLMITKNGSNSERYVCLMFNMHNLNWTPPVHKITVCFNEVLIEFFSQRIWFRTHEIEVFFQASSVNLKAIRRKAVYYFVVFLCSPESTILIDGFISERLTSCIFAFFRESIFHLKNTKFD